MNRNPFRGGPGGDIGSNPLQRARLALSNNQPLIAEDICRRRLEKKPDDLDTRLMLAQALVQLNRHKEGIIELRRILKERPNSVDALIIYSAALLGSNQANPPKEAVDIAERAVQLQPKSARTHIQLAEALMVRKEFDRAEQEAEEAVRLDPRMAHAHLIKSLSLTNTKDWEGALKSAQSAIRCDRNLAPAYLTMSQALTELKRGDEALEALDTAQKIDPSLPGSQVVQLRSTIFRKQRRYRDSYNVYLNQIKSQSLKPNRFAPLLAALNFGLSFFGQNGPYVLVAIIATIAFFTLFGLSKIPVAGGVIVDILLFAIIAVLGWNAIKMATGQNPLERLQNPRTVVFTAGTFAASVAIVFGIAALLAHFFTPAHHTAYWFTSLSVGFAGVIGLIAATVMLNYADSIGG